MLPALDRTSEQSIPIPRSLTVRELLEHEDMRELCALSAGAGGVLRQLTHPRIQKSGLGLAGHMRGIVPTRVQILGETEVTYLQTLAPDVAEERIRALYDLELSCVVVTRDIEPPPILLRHAARTDTPLVVSVKRSSTTINAIHRALDRLLAPSATLHGVLVDIHGVGVLLLGPSGIGKSECALFLVERGHRLVADDQVVLTLQHDNRVSGRPAPLLRHHMEVRGIGILNIRDLFGATAVRESGAVDLVVELCPWRQDETYERLGLDDQTHDLLGIPVPKLRIPVTPGRDMGVLLEVAARNQLLKRAGQHPAQKFVRALSEGLGLPDVEGGDGPAK
jgi:HPr kinase/phosphorylase